jgi:tRNA G18 (ribose-2'-O)-methylase SpoU
MMKESKLPGDISIYMNLRDANLTEAGICIGEGQFVVERMIRARSIEPISVLCTGNLEKRYSDMACGRFPVIIASESRMSSIAGFPFHRGVMAAALRPERISLSDFLDSNPAATRIIVCTRVSEVENIGSIIRSGRAFGFDAVLIGAGSCDPFNRKAIRCSMAGCFYLPVIETDFGNAAIALRRHGFTLVGTTPDDHSIPLAQFAGEGSLRVATDAGSVSGNTDSSNAKVFDRRGRYAIVFGHEGSGLSADERSMCDIEVRIPIDAAADSLNIGVAAGIFLHYFGKYR